MSSKVIEVTEQAIKELKQKLVELHEEYDRVQANDTNKQVEIAREINRVFEAVNVFENFLANYRK